MSPPTGAASPIRKLLVANRGEIARRVMRSAHARGTACVALYSDPDAHAPHVAEADEAVRLPGASPAETYLRIDAVVEAARRTGADAVHPGYGFLSENAAFAAACADAGVTFVGPPVAAIEAMGSKLAAKEMMAAAGVPLLPTVRVAADGGSAGGGSAGGDGRPIAEQAAALGWPVLVKASAGGGGRGMRIVHDADQLPDALQAASREAASAFGDGAIFIEPYAERPRHVEVQIIGDAHGSVVSLFERECSIQRRHQKIVEECPSPAVDEALRAELGTAAVTAAKTIGYTNAGTVEFLLLPDGRFAFLEVNTRLQVEHPVTEMVTGLDLVRLQLLVAEGHPLPDEALAPARRGHAVEVRLYAEDATADWRPSVGRLHRFRVPPGPRAETRITIRTDSGVEDGSEVSPWYDPMLAKVIAHAPTRAEAAGALAAALAGAELHGLTTNRDLLVRILRHPEFLAGDFDTGFLVRHDPAELGRPLADAGALRRHAVAAALAAQARRRAEAVTWASLPSGWRNVPSELQTTRWRAGDGELAVGYRFDGAGRAALIAVDDEPAAIGVDDAGAESVTLTEAGVQRRYRVHLVGETAYVDGPDGSSALTAAERFPRPDVAPVAGACIAPLPGSVVRVAVAVGDEVVAGAVLVAIEAMKMEHEVHAAHDGRVAEVRVAPGDQVDAGALLVVVDEAASEAAGT